MRISVLTVMPLDSKYLDVFLKSIKSTKDFGVNIIEVLAYEYNDSQKVFDYKFINYKGIGIKIHRGPNIGFGKANNYLSKFAQGSHLFFLNPDARIKHLDLDELNMLVERYSLIGIRQEIITEEKFFSNSPDEFDSEINFSGLSADIFFNASLPRKKIDPLYADGAALFLSKKIFEDLNGFSEDFFLFVEDIEFSLRARIYGIEIGFTDHSTVQHISGGFISGGSVKENRLQLNHFRRYLTQVNQIKTAVRILSIYSLIFWIPLYLFINFCYSLLFILFGKFSYGLIFFRATYAAIISLPIILVQRKIIQSTRIKNDFTIFRLIRLIPSHVIIFVKHILKIKL